MTLSHLPSSSAASASPRWCFLSCSSLTSAHDVRISLLPRTCFAPRLSCCPGGKLLASFTIGVMSSGLSVEVGHSLPGLYPWWAKLPLVTSRSPPGFVLVTKALAMTPLSAAASLLAILPPCSSQFCPLVLYCHTPLTSWHPTAQHRLTPNCHSPVGTLLLIVVGWNPLGPVAPLAYLPLRLSDLSSVTPSCGIALPPWLVSNDVDQCNNLRDCASCFTGPTVHVFSPVGDQLPTPCAGVSGLRTGGFLRFGDPAEGLQSFYLYVSMNCFITCLGCTIAGAKPGTLFL